MQSPGYDIRQLVQEAQYRWLKPAEVLFILQNHENQRLTEFSPQMPPSGSLFLFNKRVLRFFRKDGHSWRKKKDGRTVGEAHERLKVGNVEALNCYYAHGDVNPNFQRRSYWMLDPAYEHIVLVHYREINEGRHRAGSNSQGSPGLSYTSSQSPSVSTTPNLSSNFLQEPYRNSFSPDSVEVSSDIINRNNGPGQLDVKHRIGDLCSSPESDVSHALRRLEHELSLNDDDIEESYPYYGQNEDLGVLNYNRTSHQDEFEVLKVRESHIGSSEHVGTPEDSTSNVVLQIPGDNWKQQPQNVHPEFTTERKESPFWKETLELCSNSTWMNLQEKSLNIQGESEKTVSHESERLSAYLTEQPEEQTSQWIGVDGNDAKSSIDCSSRSENSLFQQLSDAKHFLLGFDDADVSLTPSSLPQVVENSAPLVKLNPCDVKSERRTMWFNQESQATNPHRPRLDLTPQKKFSIQEISPEYGYATEHTKVIITGQFLFNPSECAWACMFGDIEVPVEIIQEGVLRCQAPPNVTGKVPLHITSGNRESCSEVREFEYLAKASSHQEEPTKSTEELLLLVRFAQMLLSDSLVQISNTVDSRADSEDPWEHIIGELLFGTATPFKTMDYVLQELLKDKMQQWLSSRTLSRKEQGIIHMVAGLGFEWAVNPILSSGVSINFRDINGWTPLHWAARFGREKMVASLVASGASALAVTDPTSLDPAGKTAGYIASASGHKGLAGYLSELALTSHLTSLTLGETEFSKGSAVLEAERRVESISKESFGSTEDQLSLKDSLAAVRNAAQAAARIQSAFRAHSFRRRQQNESHEDDIHELSTASKLAFRNLRDHNLDTAAVSIQKKYRGWKGRKDFLTIRQKVVRIQAHVRGYQVRKKYIILWAVGVLDKVVLRWRRKGTGLRGFRPESECIEETEDEDILKVFRKQKVDVAIEDAVSQVLSMVESPDARQQYRRMLESYRQAKAESSSNASERGSVVEPNADMEAEDDEFLVFQ